MASPLLRTYALYRPELSLVLVVLVLGLLVNGGFAVQQHCFGLALEDLRSAPAQEMEVVGRLWRWSALILGLTLGRGLLGWTQAVLAAVLGQRVLFGLRARILDQIQALDEAWHRRHGAGEVITRATRDADMVRDAVVIGSRQLLDTLLVIAAVLSLLWWYDPLLGAVPTLAVVVALLWMLRLTDRLVALSRRADERYEALTGHFAESVAGVRVVKAFALEGGRLEGYGRRVAAFMRAAARALRWSALRLPLPQALVALAHGWVLGWGAYLVGQGRLGLGEMVAGLMVYIGVIFRVEAVTRSVRLFADARASAARLWELLDARPALRSGDRAPAAGPLPLRLQGVAVAGERAPILDGLDLELRPGSVLAIVGATGSGKSSLAALCARFRDPDRGRVLLGDDDLRRLDLAALRRAVQVVPQESLLFSDSIAGNLRLGRPEASDAELWAALTAAGAAEFVRVLPDGLATAVGERGVTLSGGQRQRLCLARALIAQPQVLVLDDATSAIDASTERAILEGLRRELAGMGVLIMASRLSSVLLADEVAVLDGGRLVARGSHDALARSNRGYRELLCLDEEAA